jgi:hypothetical protein
MARYRADLIETAWNNELVYGTKPTTLDKGWGIVTAGITLPDPRYEWTPFYGIGVEGRNLLTHIQGRESYEGSVGTIMLCHDASRLIVGDSIGQIFNVNPKISAIAGCTPIVDQITMAGSGTVAALTGISAGGAVTAGQEPKYIVVISQANDVAPLPFTDTFAYVGAISSQVIKVHHSPNTNVGVDVGWQGKVPTGNVQAAIYSIERGAPTAVSGPDGVLASTNSTHTSSIGIRETLRQQSFTLGSKIHTDSGKALVTNYMGNKVGTTSFNFAENSPVTFTVNFTGQDMVHNMVGGTDLTIVKHRADAVSPAMTPVTEQPYFFSKANLKFGGTTFAKFRTLSISINNQLDPRYYVTQSASTDNRQILSEILEGRRSISISGSLDMDDTGTGAAAGAQAGPDVKFLQYLFNQGFNQNDPRDVAAADLIGVSIEVELRRYSDASVSANDFDTLTFKLPANETLSATNPGLILSAARMPIPAPPQVHQNLDIEGITTSMKIEIKDSIA